MVLLGILPLLLRLLLGRYLLLELGNGRLDLGAGGWIAVGGEFLEESLLGSQRVFEGSARFAGARGLVLGRLALPPGLELFLEAMPRWWAGHLGLGGLAAEMLIVGRWRFSCAGSVVKKAWRES